MFCVVFKDSYYTYGFLFLGLVLLYMCVLKDFFFFFFLIRFNIIIALPYFVLTTIQIMLKFKSRKYNSHHFIFQESGKCKIFNLAYLLFKKYYTLILIIFRRLIKTFFHSEWMSFYFVGLKSNIFHLSK